MKKTVTYCAKCGGLKEPGNTWRNRRNVDGFATRCIACSKTEGRKKYFTEYNHNRPKPVKVMGEYVSPYKGRRPCRFSGCGKITTSKSGYCRGCMNSMISPLMVQRKRKASKRQWQKIKAKRLQEHKRCLGCGVVLSINRGKSQDYCLGCYPKLKCVLSYCRDCGGAMRPSSTLRCSECKIEFDERRAKRYTKAASARAKSSGSIATKYKRKLKSGGCVVCSYDRDLNALEFHHLFGKKGKELSRIKHISSVNKEIEKNPVIVLCANCHRELHSGLIDEGSLVRYRLQPNRVQVSLFRNHQTRKKK